MDATYNFSLSSARASESKVETPDRLLSRRTLLRIATRISLVSQAIGFSVLGILIIMNRHQAELKDFSDSSSIGIVGGISALLVGTVFLVAACLHWRFCARHQAALPVRRQSFRFTFARPTLVHCFIYFRSRFDAIGGILVRPFDRRSGAVV
jgi:hypothetical protein